MIPDLAWSFVTGLVGSLHCLGMCGPLVIAYSLQLRDRPGDAAALPWKSGLGHHLAYHAGRTITYGILGGLGAGLVYLGGAGHSLMTARNGAAFFGGLLMVILGVVLLKIFPVPFATASAPAAEASVFSRFIRARLSSGGRSSGLLLGIAAGFLPCMLSWAMVVKAATTGNPFQGFLLMALFGLGTIPALLFTGFAASLLSLRMRLLGERVAAASVVIMGFLLMWKGAAPYV